MITRDHDSYPVHKTLTEHQPEPIVHVSGSVTYKGYAPLGTPVGFPGWKILRITTSSGVTITEYADGDMKYDNIWSNRESLNFSR